MRQERAQKNAHGYPLEAGVALILTPGWYQQGPGAAESSPLPGIGGVE